MERQRVTVTKRLIHHCFAMRIHILAGKKIAIWLPGPERPVINFDAFIVAKRRLRLNGMQIATPSLGPVLLLTIYII